MRKYNNLLLLVFIFLVNCNYKPILSSTETGFSIDKIEFLNTNKINSKLEKQLSIYQKNKSKSKFYDLFIDASKDKAVCSHKSNLLLNYYLSLKTISSFRQYLALLKILL